jgi:hypothetical protein
MSRHTPKPRVLVLTSTQANHMAARPIHKHRAVEQLHELQVFSPGLCAVLPPHTPQQNQDTWILLTRASLPKLRLVNLLPDFVERCRRDL